MLYYKSMDGSGDWHVGEDFKPASGCYYIQADGDELAYVATQFSNIPLVNDLSVIWEGPFAEFIGRNLR